MLVQVRVIHGSLVTKSRTYGVGEVVELQDSAVREMDPRGECFEILPAPVEEELLPNVVSPAPEPEALTNFTPKRRKKGSP